MTTPIRGGSARPGAIPDAGRVPGDTKAPPNPAPEPAAPKPSAPLGMPSLNEFMGPPEPAGVWPPARSLPKLDLGVTPSPEVAAKVKAAVVGSLLPSQGAPALANPTDALAFVKSGTMAVKLPLPEALKLHPMVKVKPGTMLHLDAVVKDGKLDPAQTKVRIVPPLETLIPFITVGGLEIDKKGRLSVDIDNCPDLKLGGQLPLDMPGFAKALQDGQENGLDVRILGIKVAKQKLGDADTAKAFQNIQGTVSVKDVELSDRELSLSSGVVKLAKGSKVNVEGSFDDLRITGNVGIDAVQLREGGVEIKGSDGRADLSVRYQSSPGGMKVSTAISRLDLKTDYAVTERANGDFVKLAQGQIKDGSINVELFTGGDGKVQSSLSSLEMEKFYGYLAGARLTVPDGSGTARITVGPSKVVGDLSVNSERVLFKGDLDVEATVEDYQSGTGMDLKRVDVRGAGTVDFNSQTGFSFTGGGLEVSADLNKASLAMPSASRSAATELGAGSKLRVKADQLSLTRAEGLQTSGRAEVDLNVQGFNAGKEGVVLTGDKARISGGANLSLKNGSFALTQGDLKLDASLSDGKIDLPNGMSLDLKAGTQLKTALSSAAFGPAGVAFEFQPGSSLRAELDSGRIALPGGTNLDLKSGTQVAFTFDKLAYDSKGFPTVKGSMTLDANVSANQVDVKALTRLPQLSFGVIKGYEQHLKVALGNFEIAKDGAFEIDDMSFGLEARIKKFSGKLKGR